MRRKNYVAIAAVIKSQYIYARTLDNDVCRGQALLVIDRTVDGLVSEFIADSAKFNARIFRTACGQ